VINLAVAELIIFRRAKASRHRALSPRAVMARA
jgi:hypothetical protein